MSNKVPRRIAKYEIERVLGSGAMGIVYKGYDRKIERPVAIKVLHDHLRNSPQGTELERRFLQEAKAAARCLHPNLVAIFDFGHDFVPYIVMEYVEGIELKAYLRSNTDISLPSATDICIQILKAVGHAHENGIVHRDIKPSNIIVLNNGSIKVSDFGVAHLDTSELTNTGFMVGTPNYMSPEGLQGRQADHRSDIYSVGVLYFELLSGLRPSRDLSIEQNLDALDNLPQLSLQNIRSIKPILRKALHPSQEQRFQSSNQFIQQLETIDDMDLTLAATAIFKPPKGYRTQASQDRHNYSSSQYSYEVLELLEHTLARYLGPVARVLVKKSSRTSTGIEQLITELTEQIPTAEERQQFTRTIQESGLSHQPEITSSQQSSGKQQPEDTSAITLDNQRQLSQLLSFYLGPLAGRMVKRQSTRSTNLNDLIGKLSLQIPNPSERDLFLNQANKLMGAAR